MAYYTLRANSLYDPDHSGVGEQPMGFDQLAALYAHYVVLSSRCKFYPVVFEASNSYTMLHAIHLNSSYTPVQSNALYFIEQPRDVVTYKWTQTVALGNGSDVHPLISPVYNAKKFFGKKDPQDAASDIGASVGANPTDGAFFIYLAQASSGYNVTAYTVPYEIEYNALFFEPEEIAHS